MKNNGIKLMVTMVIVIFFGIFMYLVPIKYFENESNRYKSLTKVELEKNEEFIVVNQEIPKLEKTLKELEALNIIYSSEFYKDSDIEQENFIDYIDLSSYNSNIILDTINYNLNPLDINIDDDFKALYNIEEMVNESGELVEEYKIENVIHSFVKAHEFSLEFKCDYGQLMQLLSIINYNKANILTKGIEISAEIDKDEEGISEEKYINHNGQISVSMPLEFIVSSMTPEALESLTVNEIIEEDESLSEAENEDKEEDKEKDGE